MGKTAVRARRVDSHGPAARSGNRFGNVPSTETRGGERGASDGVPVTTYEASNALLNTYQTRRKMLSKAAQLSSHMLSEAKIIAEIEEENLLLTVHKDTAGAQTQDAVAESAEVVGDEAAREGDAATPTDDAAAESELTKDEAALTAPDKGIALQVQTDVELIQAQIGRKRDKLRVLRGLQQSILELDERAEKEEELRAQRARWLGGDGQQVSETASGAETRLPSSRNKAVTALRENLYEMLNAEQREAAPSSPPKVFTSNALAITLECMDRSLAALVEASDAVCVATTFNARNEPVLLQGTLQQLRTQCDYLHKCCELALSHEAHFEVGERALREGGAFEVNFLREQFLHRKETLTRQEQAERVAEEQRSGLRTRLRNLLRRCDMWEEVFFHRQAPAPPAALERLLSAAQDAQLARRWPSERRFSVFRRSFQARPSSGGHAPGGARQSIVAATSHDEDNNNNTDDGGVASGMAGSSATQPAVTLPPIAARLFARGAALPSEDAMELRVAQTWGNPYIHRACQYSHAAQPATSLVPARTASPSLLTTRRRSQRASFTLSARDGVGDEGGGRGRVRSASMVSFTVTESGSRGSTSEELFSDHTTSDDDLTDPIPSATARAVAEARTMGLLQSLLRTIPTAMADVEGSAPELTAQQALRLTTRASIQKLVRHLASLGRRSSDVN